MFKKRFRLNTSDFKEVFNFGKTTATPFFLIKSKKSNLTYSRFAVVVSKKLHKKAVQRNHLKRRCMVALKESSSHYPVADYIFILNSKTKDVQYQDLLNNLKNIKL
jgi:ribonuclease P protein component